MKVLFLFESILPNDYHSSTTSPGELRVIAQQEQVDKVVALGRSGKSFYDVSVDTPIKSDLENKIRISHFTWPNNQLSYYFSWIGMLWRGYWILKSEKFEIIHAESPHISGIAALILGKLFNAKVLVEYRVNYDELFITRYGKFWGSCIKSLFWVVSTITIKSANYVLANCQSYVGFLKTSLRIHHVGFYNPGVRVPKRFAKRQGGSITVGFIGRLFKDKGPMYFLRIVNLEKSWFKKNNIHFILAGDGPEKTRLLAYIEANHLGNLVEMMGTVDRWVFFERVDIHINTTIVKSALEMTNAEAGSVGVPTIAFGGNGYPETVRDAFSGYVIKAGDVHAMCAKLKHLILKNSLYLQMQKNAVEYSTPYSFQSQISNLATIYKAVLL